MRELDVDVWLLTEVRDDAEPPYSHVARSPALATATSRRPMRWSAVCSRWPLEERPSAHEGLALAVVQAASGALVAASSVLPWRGAGAHWPGDATARLEDRFRLALDEQRAQIEQAAAGGPVVWGGDFNVALQGDDRPRRGPDRLAGPGGAARARAQQPRPVPGARSADLSCCRLSTVGDHVVLRQAARPVRRQHDLIRGRTAPTRPITSCCARPPDLCGSTTM